jgi:hypothetical protein
MYENAQKNSRQSAHIRTIINTTTRFAKKQTHLFALLCSNCIEFYIGLWNYEILTSNVPSQ